MSISTQALTRLATRSVGERVEAISVLSDEQLVEVSFAILDNANLGSLRSLVRAEMGERLTARGLGDRLR